MRKSAPIRLLVAGTLALSPVALAPVVLSTGAAAQTAPTPPASVDPSAAPSTTSDPSPAAPAAAPAVSLKVQVEVALIELTTAARIQDAARFQKALTPEFVDVVDRYQALLKDAPENVAANYTWAAFMRTFARENPIITTVTGDDQRVQAQVTRNGNVGTLLFRKVGPAWKLDVQPALARQVTNEENKRGVGKQEETAPDAVIPPTSPHAASQPAGHPSVPDGAASQPAMNAGTGSASQPTMTTTTGVGEVQIAPMPSPAPGPFDPGQPLHYVWYAPDYVFIAGAAGMYLFDGYSLLQNGLQGANVPSLIGPSFNFDDPDLDALNDPRLNSVVGNPFFAEKVSPVDAAIFGLGTLGVMAVSDVRHLDFHHTHAFTVGALTATMGALTAAELGKAVVRRLRPDFRERYTRAACNDVVTAPDGIDCSIAADGFQLTQDDLDDGMKSFPSGHSAFSFAAATYGALYLGGEFIWGQDAGMVATPLAALGVTGLYSVAAFMSASRIADNKHHIEDVAVGSALGAGIAAATYFLHFDLQGNARWRGFQVAPVAYDEGGGVSVNGRF